MNQTRFLTIYAPATPTRAALALYNGEAKFDPTPNPILRMKPRLDYYHDFLTVCSCGKRGLIRFSSKTRTFHPSEINPDWVFTWDDWMGDMRSWNCGALGHAQINPGLKALDQLSLNFVEDLYGRCPMGFWVNTLLNDYGRNHE